VDCYQLNGPYNVVYKVEPELSGTIKINSITPDAYPFSGIYYGGITTTLEAESNDGWVFDHWETLHHGMAPSLSDSLVTLTFTTGDTIVAHFVPPTQYPVVLLVDPPGTASITYNADLYSSFPTTVERPAESVDTLTVHPEMYYDFLYWEFRYNTPNQHDTTMRTIPVTIFYPDTIIAHLQAQDYVYYVADAFSPNGDGFNDTWRPWNNVVDLDHYQLLVFDRWGREVFSTTDPYKEWDGTFDGERLPMGVYAFKANMLEGITRKEHEAVGHVTLVP
jgi:gliding motility-associated-like protein